MASQHCCSAVTCYKRELVFTISSSSLNAGICREKNLFSEWKRKHHFPCALCRKLLVLTLLPVSPSTLQLHFSTDSMEVKPIMTRKLRRRPNDPVPIPDKRRKPAPDILQNHWRAFVFEVSTLPARQSASLLLHTGRKRYEVLESGFSVENAQAEFVMYVVWLTNSVQLIYGDKNLNSTVSCDNVGGFFFVMETRLSSSGTFFTKGSFKRTLYINVEAIDSVDRKWLFPWTTAFLISRCDKTFARKIIFVTLDHVFHFW